VREKNVKPIIELLHLLEIGDLKSRIQEHFWREICDAINRTYKTYEDATAAIRGKPTTSKPIERKFPRLDLSAAWKKVPELEAEINSQEDALAFLKGELAKDEDRLRSRLDAIPTCSDLITSERRLDYIVIFG
jgi:hypothetical protein